jgi:hypothetical protein
MTRLPYQRRSLAWAIITVAAASGALALVAAGCSTPLTLWKPWPELAVLDQ